jgi:hypothetical protein
MPEPLPRVAERVKADNASNIASGHKRRLRLKRAELLAVENPLTHCCPVCGVSLYDPGRRAVRGVRRCFEGRR